ncbi:hypothetical protein IC229_34865 [Spirosoma sp. BT702]|uniref:Uncharacterized protein n=1 Tax=Spirosoma profusum TaxID=2771354 RepID=A0A927GB11_9BACT|nr:hypothetical protein [Spirosoma profusum]MBD2705833.1 hypothetical protein [Spirosoma profusum]
MKPTVSTMATVFEMRPLEPQSFMQRLLNQHPIENAVIELNNVLASSAICSIPISEIDRIERKYGLSLTKQFGLNLEEFYAVYLNYALDDSSLSEEELADLTHLRILLQLPNQTIELLHARVGAGIYQQCFEEVIQDGVISSEERYFLSQLEQTLSLPSDLANKISEEVRSNYFARLAEEYSADARITPEEERQLQQISKNLGIKPDQATKRTLDRYKLYWVLENADLPIIEISLPLQKQEHCHWHSEDVQWFEERATARRTSYDDHYVQDKVFEEVDLQANSPAHQTKFGLLKRIDTGQLFLTNKRIIFVGRLKTTSIKLNTIGRVTAFKQGIEIGKLTGKNPLLLLKGNADVAAVVCRRLIRNA